MSKLTNLIHAIFSYLMHKDGRTLCGELGAGFHDDMVRFNNECFPDDKRICLESGAHQTFQYFALAYALRKEFDVLGDYDWKLIRNEIRSFLATLGGMDFYTRRIKHNTWGWGDGFVNELGLMADEQYKRQD